MAVPKKQSSKSRRNMRRFASGNRLGKPTSTMCTECNEPVRPHSICGRMTECSYYKKKTEKPEARA